MWEAYCLQGEDDQGRMAPTFSPWILMLQTEEPWVPRPPQKKGTPHCSGEQVRPGQRQRLGWPHSVPVALGDRETGEAAGVSTGRDSSGPAPGWDLPGIALPCKHPLKEPTGTHSWPRAAGPEAGWPCLGFGGSVGDNGATLTLSPEPSGRPRTGPMESGRHPCPV